MDGLVFFGLTDDFAFMLHHREAVVYSDDESVIVRELPRSTLFVDGPELHPVVGLAGLPVLDEDQFQDPADFHKIGGSSFWLRQHPNNDLHFLAQLAFPDCDDLALDLDWPTADMTLELFRDTKQGVLCAVWRMHA
jgi:hypothetical protein